MRCLGIFLGPSEAFALLRVDVHHYGVIYVANLFKGGDERLHVVALLHVAIVESKGVEEVAFAGALGPTELRQVVVHASGIVGDGPLVVVEHHNEVFSQRRRVVEPLEGLSAAKRAIAKHRDHVVALSQKVARLGQAACEAHGLRGVPSSEQVVFALAGIGKARILVVVRRIGIGTLATREHLVRIALVRDVEHELVCGKVKHVVQCHGCLHESQIGAQVTARYRNGVYQSAAGFVTERPQFVEGKATHIGRTLDATENATHMSPLPIDNQSYYEASDTH